MADRFPMPEELSPAQLAAKDAVMAGPRGALVGPFVPLLRAPDLMHRVQELGAHLRYETALADHLRELVILQAARHWNQEFEWGHHQPIALAAGLPSRVVDDLSEGAEPVGADADVLVVWHLVNELLTTKAAGDKTYAAALDLLDEQRVIEIVTIAGYYSMLAMIMITAATPPEPGAPLLGERAGGLR